MKKADFDRIRSSALSFQHSSFQYLEFDDVADYQIIANQKDLILLRGYNPDVQSWQYHWAANKVNDLICLPPSDAPIFLSFVPKEWVPALKAAGMEIHCIWHDYFRSDLNDIEDIPNVNIRFLSIDEVKKASEVTMLCRGQSRGFSGQSPDWLRRWLSGSETVKDTAILGLSSPTGDLAGILCTGLYGHDLPTGPIVWIKEIAVKPAYQGKGIGRKLINQALRYGKQHGAQRAFLAVDEENIGAIHLYESVGFVRSEEEGEINMIMPSVKQIN